MTIRNGRAKGKKDRSRLTRTPAKRRSKARDGGERSRASREIFPAFALRLLDRLGLDRSSMLAEPEPTDWDRRAT